VTISFGAIFELDNEACMFSLVSFAGAGAGAGAGALTVFEVF
jgi:hypothetical protein